MVLSPEHPLVEPLTTTEQRTEVNVYRRAAAAKDIISRKVGDRDKTGVFTGSYARNPATDEAIPVWVADYVLMEYGTGAIMAVPAHDHRDYEFAKKFGLEVQVVVQPTEDMELDDGVLFTGWEGTLVNSGQFDGMSCRDAVPAVTKWLEESGAGQMREQFRLHDWCISRQRYWGPPIPMINCEDCGTVPVPESDLPVLLPYVEDFRPDESGVSPLARHEEWYRVPCPRCGADARRETDVSDTFLDSSWYFLRYPSTEFDDRPFDTTLTKRWLPVHSYIGGNEHAVLHLLYSRFVTMALHDLGHLEFAEPFSRFRAHGMIVKDGAKMSKSRGNVVIPDEFVKRWGADTFRMYLMFLGPYQEGGDFRDKGIAGLRRFLDRVWEIATHAVEEAAPDVKSERKLHQTIRGVAEDLEELRYNTAIAKMMEYVNVLRARRAKDERATMSRAEVEPLIVMLAPLAPHFAEECWERFGHAETVFSARWPEYDEALAREDLVELVVQVNGKVRGRINVATDITEDAAFALALEDESVQRFVDGQEIIKKFYVPGRLVSLVVG
jgi:leucyl-tRNA synthetase